MPYNTQLANQIRKCIRANCIQWTPESVRQVQKSRLSKKSDIRFEERQLFGGLAFIINGKIALAIVRDDILIRTEKNPNPKIDFSMIKLNSPDGKPINGWALVSRANGQPETVLSRWINFGIQNTLLSDHASEII